MKGCCCFEDVVVVADGVAYWFDEAIGLSTEDLSTDYTDYTD
jgi:hypothetical protein